MEKRTCKKCGVEKELGEFPTYRQGRLHRYECKPCMNERNAVYARKYRNNHDPLIRSVRLEKKRSLRLRYDFGINSTQYENQLAKQEGVCAICKLDCPTGRKLAVDHNHTTGEVRGLLCCNCNQALGKMQDNPFLLREAAMYLESTTYRMEKV